MPLAAVRRQAMPDAITTAIISSPVWQLTGDRGLATLGQTVVVYYGRARAAGDTPILLDVGILLPVPFEGDAQLQFVETPGGRAAHLRHVGGYEPLPTLHQHIRDWCSSNGHAITGTNWEHFGHWHEEAAQRVTDLYYQLA